MLNLNSNCTDRACIRLTFLAIFLAPAMVLAQAAPPANEPPPLDILEGRPDVAAPTKLVGERFESKSTGLAFNPPAGMKRKPLKSAETDPLVHYVDESRGWQLVATQGTLSDSIALSSAEVTAVDPNAQAPAGLLELASEEIKTTYPAATILRQKVIKAGPDRLSVALLAARITADLKPVLTQQAIIKAGERAYFTMSLTSPVTERGDEEPATQPTDALEQAATEGFHAMLETVQLLDLRAIKEDQDQRLFRTRALLLNLTPTKLQAAVIPEQWLRIMHNGKDVGYSYVIEEKEIGEDRKKPQDGIRIGVRTRLFAPPPGKSASEAIAPADTVAIPGLVASTAARLEPVQLVAGEATEPAKSVQIDAETWMWISLDRRHEEWSSVVLMDNGSGERDHWSEVGSSERQMTHMLDNDLKTGGTEDPRQPPVRRADTYTLDVRTVAKRNAPAPIKRPLSPWYIPQGISHLLPRLLPLGEPKSYMFASYISGERRQVMNRYVDIGREQMTDLGGKKMRAIPIRERTGLEGPVTTHWMNPENGKYLGSTCADAGLVVIATNAADLEGIWKDKADLTRPAEPVPDERSTSR